MEKPSCWKTSDDNAAELACPGLPLVLRILDSEVDSS